MKNIYFVALFLGSVLATQASSSHASSSPAPSFKGFYVGASAGYNTGHFELQKNKDPVENLVINAVNKSQVLDSKGGVFGLNVGYGHVFSNSVYLGAECSVDYYMPTKKDIVDVNVNIPTPRGRIEGRLNAHSKTQQLSSDLMLQLGRPIQYFMPFVQAGARLSAIKIKSNFSCNLNTPIFNIQNSLDDERRALSLGFAVGGGFKVLTGPFVVTASYLYTKNSFKKSEQSNIAGTVPQNTFKVQVAYKF